MTARIDHRAQANAGGGQVCGGAPAIICAREKADGTAWCDRKPVEISAYGGGLHHARSVITAKAD